MHDNEPALGERVSMFLTVVGYSQMHSDYGDINTLIVYRDQSGNIYKWFATGEKDVHIGQEKLLTFTIKDRVAGVTLISRVANTESVSERRIRFDAKRAYKEAKNAVNASREQASRSDFDFSAHRTLVAAANSAYRVWRSLEDRT